MRHSSIPALIALMLTLPALADSNDCSASATARPLVDAFFAKGDYQDAIDRLQQTQQRQDACILEQLDANWYWLRSDLALAYLKAGREQDCLNLLDPLVGNPGSARNVMNLEDGGRVGHALETNQRLCEAAHEKRLAHYRHTPCPEVAGNALDSTAVAPGHCLVLRPASHSGACPSLEEWQDGKRLHTLTPLGEEALSPLLDTSRCCSVQQLRLAVENGQRSVRLLGEGRDCFGGTARDLIDTLYRWQGQTLTPLKDYSRSQ